MVQVVGFEQFEELQKRVELLEAALNMYQLRDKEGYVTTNLAHSLTGVPVSSIYSFSRQGIIASRRFGKKNYKILVKLADVQEVARTLYKHKFLRTQNV